MKEDSQMDYGLRNGMAGRRGNSRRQFLRDVVTNGAWVAAAASLPASAQEKAELGTARNESPAKSGGGAETPAGFAGTPPYQDFPGGLLRTVKRTHLDTVG